MNDLDSIAMGASVDSLGAVERLVRIETRTYAGNMALISAIGSSLHSNDISFSTCFDPQESRGGIAKLSVQFRI